ncbi:cytochrome c class I [Dinoroseobacter shibae DFL 12 = DSM 16493]|jgi:cytochrome c|uniref:Cytochrome c class I n=1 Tax=Dinoroseobacter shibae (strain DSM 16493 / NCIMB 14021 / DFL 12) TaxID=398580 RepID=A8LNR5_DINSH|nr:MULTISPECIES: cytochrome c class I [Dinoroseobacter]ABV92223.1 cytochrome c class I [Dinoroseobacter shibae DFL 12 = DSM 16493]MDD9717421.1 cytochrome c family protein [Dinoroseobacter sp. PD6]URF47175.1 cytochrome c family protein [Dinoroseobacter shibae]URF51486.1 cytochrome c family protein [Dinoroseobacter shibae]
MNRILAAATCLVTLPVLAMAAGDITVDAAAGEKVFRTGKAYHQVSVDAESRASPRLNGAVDRAVGSIEGFSYSDAFVVLNAEGTIRSTEKFAAFLAKPKNFEKGTMIAFAGLRKKEDRKNMIAYLATCWVEGM